MPGRAALLQGAEMVTEARATRKLRCRFCDWKCPVWYTNKRGKTMNGWALLVQHVMDRHDEIPIDAEAILGHFSRGLA